MIQALEQACWNILVAAEVGRPAAVVEEAVLASWNTLEPAWEQEEASMQRKNRDTAHWRH